MALVITHYQQEIKCSMCVITMKHSRQLHNQWEKRAQNLLITHSIPISALGFKFEYSPISRMDVGSKIGITFIHSTFMAYPLHIFSIRHVKSCPEDRSKHKRVRTFLDRETRTAQQTHRQNYWYGITWWDYHLYKMNTCKTKVKRKGALQGKHREAPLKRKSLNSMLTNKQLPQST